VDQVCNRFEAAWKAGGQPRLEDFLGDAPGPERPALLRELVLLDAYYRRRGGAGCAAEDYRARFPSLDAAWLAGALAEGVPQAPMASGTEDYAPGGAARPEVRRERPRSFGDYEILGELGRGGMGVVYQARQRTLDRLVALKVLLAGAHAGPDELDRFRSEAAALARLRHPNIVQIHEVGEHEGRPYFCLEYVEGGSLAEKLGSTPLPARAAAELVRTLAGAVHAAHQRGVVHRDLKPANVLLTAAGVPKVSDFGLAKCLDGQGGHTRTGIALGTPSYMAPEQTTGQTRHQGPATDVYALGAILYELLTGRPPFRAPTSLDTLAQVQTAEPVPPSRLQPGVARHLEAVCLTCLRKDPARRYPSAEALAEDLGRWMRGEPVRARPVRAWERAAKWVWRHPAWAALAGVSGLAAFAVLGVAVGLYANARLADANGRLQAALAREAGQRAEAERQRRRAEDLEAERRRSLYTNCVHQANQAWKLGQLAEALQLLDGYRPGPGEEDLRGFEWHYLWRACGGDRLALRGHGDRATAVAYSPDGTRLASVGADGTLVLWDAGTGRSLLTLRGPAAPLCAVAFSPDGRRLVSAGGDGPGRVRLWDAARGAEVVSWETPAGVASLAYGAGGRVALGGSDGTVRVREALTGRDVFSRQGHKGPVIGVAFDGAGEQLASIGADRVARVWRGPAGAEGRIFFRGGAPRRGGSATPASAIPVGAASDPRRPTASGSPRFGAGRSVSRSTCPASRSWGPRAAVVQLQLQQFP
jgi:hypothetical protein